MWDIHRLKARPSMWLGPQQSCLLCLAYVLVHNQAPKGEGIDWYVWLYLYQLVCDQSGAGEWKGHAGCAVYSTARDTMLYSTAHLWAGHTTPQQV